MRKKTATLSSVKVSQMAGYQIWQVSFAWQRGLKRLLDPLGITFPQLLLLHSIGLLSKEKGNMHQVDIALHSGIDPMTTSSVIRILEKKQLLKREEHPADTRAKTVVLTTEGIKMARQGIKVMEKFDKQFFEVLGIREKTLRNSVQQLVKCLTGEGIMHGKEAKRNG